MKDLKYVMQDNYLQYASYVILERAIPSVVDGLKPVQRRILHTLFGMHDGKLHKVANVAGQTMAFHPHGDAPINDALVNLANKGYLLDIQGNFGNIYTGDPAAAPRYIETRLAELTMETMFNPDLTEFLPSYDGRNMEPVTLPAKIPLLLMQGAEGIAVGMATRVLPHNPKELMEAQIAILEGKDYTILPDFPTGGLMDPSDYDRGRGKVRLRAKIEEKDAKTVVVKEICHGTTTESVIRSIDEAAKRGKIKIDSISDYTAETPEIEIKLPRGQYADKLIEALYAFTDCEVSLNSQVVVIKDNLPWETDVHAILEHNTENLTGYLRRELEIERDRLNEKVYQKTLEQIFIENRLYKPLEKVKKADQIHDTVAKSLKPYHKELSREPNKDDRERLLAIPIRRITLFDLDKNQEAIAEMLARIDRIEKDLKRMKAFTIKYLKGLLKKYAVRFPRRTVMTDIAVVDKRQMAAVPVKVGFDPKSGFLGTKVKGDAGIECTSLDKLLVMFSDGTYKVMNVPEKLYVHDNGLKVIYAGVADKKTVISVAYRNKKTKHAYAKRFVVKQFILDREYRFMEEGAALDVFTTEPDVTLYVQFVPKARQKTNSARFEFSDVAVKGVSAKGIRVSPKEVKKVKVSGRK